MKKLLFGISLVCLSLLTGCSFFQESTLHVASFDSEAEYNLYADLLGNVGLVQITDITADGVEHSDPHVFNFKEAGMTVGSMVEAEGKIFASIHDDTNLGGVAQGNKVAVLEKNKVKRYLEFPDYKGLSRMIKDKSGGSAYVMAAVRPAEANPAGVPLLSFNTETEEKLPLLSVKGIPGGYTEKGEDLYLAVSGADKLGYSDVPDSYIARVEEGSRNVEIVATLDKQTRIEGIAAGEDRLFLVTTVPKDEGKGMLSTFNFQGEHLRDYDLAAYPFDLLLNNGSLYISHRGARYDGDQVTVFDTKTNEIVKEIHGFIGAGHMDKKDQYLFVSNEGDPSVAVIDMEINKLIDTIEFGKGDGTAGIVITGNGD